MDIMTALVTISTVVITVFGGFKLVEYRVRVLEKSVENIAKEVSKIPVIENKIENLEKRISDIERGL